jgi:hypothetical protein
MERGTARPIDGVGVAAVDVVVRAPGTPAASIVERQRDPDSRPVHGTSIAICGILTAWRRW